MKPNVVPRAEQIPFYFREPWRLQIQGSPGKVNWLLEYISRTKASLLFCWTADSIRSTQSGISFTVTVVSYSATGKTLHIRYVPNPSNKTTVLFLGLSTVDQRQIFWHAFTPPKIIVSTLECWKTAKMNIRVLFYLSNSSSRSTGQDPSID
jgi:hypothetical protein